MNKSRQIEIVPDMYLGRLQPAVGREMAPTTVCEGQRMQMVCH
jgi:hypothetical protein